MQNINQTIISVVMSVYNGELFLKDAIESILNQSYQNFEFIIINDGSSDSSLSIIKSYNDSRIKLVENERNMGLIYSLNKAFSIASGKYIARMDSDDIAHSDRLKLQIEFLENNPSVGLVGSDYISFSDKHSKLIREPKSHGVIKTFLLFSATMCHPTVMLRKQILDDTRSRYNPEFKHVEDYELWTKLILHTQFANLPTPLLKYRDHQSQVSHKHKVIQTENGDIVRENYLKSLGFSYSPSQLSIHQLIASNQKIESFVILNSIESWLLQLTKHNEVSKVILHEDFQKAILKIWKDCCGNTNLGLKAYFKYLNSDLTKALNASLMPEFKLLAKCIIRKY